MVKRHIKRIAAPKTWNIAKKVNKFITRPKPGAHSFRFGLPLSIIFKDILTRATSLREVKRILQNNTVLVDGKRRVDPKFIAGLMDSISIEQTKEYFRVMLDTRGKIMLKGIDEKESKIKVLKIIKKTKVRGGNTQLNLFGSRNIIVDKDDYKLGDSVVLSLPEQKIKEHLKLEKGALVYLTGGKNIGRSGKIESIEGSEITIKSKSKKIVTLKDYAFVVGGEKPAITLIDE